MTGGKTQEWLNKLKREIKMFQTYEFHLNAEIFLKLIWEKTFSKKGDSFFKRSRDHEEGKFKYTEQANSHRKKRQFGGNRKDFPDGKSVCSLYLKTDPSLYAWIFKREGNQVNKLFKLKRFVSLKFFKNKHNF